MISLNLDSRLFVRKTQTPGWSDGNFSQPRTISLVELIQNTCTLHLEREQTGVIRAPTCLQIVFVAPADNSCGEIEETLHVGVIGQCLSHVVDLHARVLAAHIENEEHLLEWERSRRNVDQRAVGGSPHGVELSFDKHAGTFPDHPASDQGASFAPHDQLNEREALIVWRAHRRKTRHPKRFAAGHYPPHETHQSGVVITDDVTGRSHVDLLAVYGIEGHLFDLGNEGALLATKGGAA